MKKNSKQVLPFILAAVVSLLLLAGYKYQEHVVISAFLAKTEARLQDDLRIAKKIADRVNELGSEMKALDTEDEAETEEGKETEDSEESSETFAVMKRESLALASLVKDAQAAAQEDLAQLDTLLKKPLLPKTKKNLQNIQTQLKNNYQDSDFEFLYAEMSFLNNMAEVLEQQIAASEALSQADEDKDYDTAFSNLATLKKYTQEDFQFPSNELIIKYDEKAAEWLEVNRKMLAIYYEYAQDMAKGDADLAAHKLSSIVELSAETNSDFDFFEDSSDAEIERIKIEISRALQLKESLSNIKGKYYGLELLGQDYSFKSNTSLDCFVWESDFSVYMKINDAYPEATNLTEFAAELDSFNIQHPELNEELVQFVSSNDKIGFICSEPSMSETFDLSTVTNDKYLEE